jgi:hypothetical protein
VHKTFSTIKLKMESNKNNNNNGGDQDEQQQFRGSAPKRKFNELTNDGDKPAKAAGEDDQNGDNKKNREDGDNMDLEVCILQYIFWLKKSENNP